ncbi:MULTISPECIES: type VI secretion system baseplate subunit TssF [Paraburkholderia]|uniref:Type VI secretion system protein ImpG n=1 Tax=Paraburkholderia terricola TaxID=169427 RepID=A0A1M6WE01_9BURK|nr:MULTISPECIES: type VI secretion system baseplate subunit TssF [Paraburkholderia]ORC51211.1 type VI secretion protein [Burkholderia sp. A27]SDP17646.1 type VI secretion system protein ImpG [Paraburkholderia sediminicola]SHK91898.1 type VI secretion system protein ImpG [Paraburkholderia terricola]
MDPRLLDYYNQELIYMRELAGEFAQAHPKIARRLGMQAGEVADPYVERLIESFCFMAARMQIKLDAEFPRFTGRLLEVVYPNYVAPTPSMAVARLYPGRTEGSLARGYRIARGTALTARVPDGEKTACQFRSGQDVTLWPLEITEARLTGIPPDIPALDRYVPANAKVRGALRLKLRTTGDARIADLEGLDRLPVYLAGDEQVASHLFELLHTAGVATITAAPGEFNTLGRPLHSVSANAIAHEGLGTDQGLLPLAWSKFHGHNLLHEYFACPSRFYFFALTGLEKGLRQVNGREVEIVVLLDQSTERLANLVDASRFALFCTPVINLFPKHTDRIELSAQETEFRIVPARLTPLDYEVFSVGTMIGQVAETSEELEFRPLYQTLNNDEGNHGRYFSTRRERRLMSDSARRYGTRTPYIGTEMFVSLVDQNEAPYSEHIRFLSVDALVTNRDLPSLVPRDGVRDLKLARSAPLESIGLIRAPTAPKAPYAEREMAWRLIRQLNFNYLPFDDLDHRAGGQGLRDLLRLFLTGDDAEHQRQVESLVGVKTQPVTRKLPGNGPLVFGRGIECALTVDEAGFSGTSPYLFGLILEHYLARHVSINTFTQTELHSMQRGRVARWPVRMGTRGIA